ncbi:MAG: IclR family transcriptional regulator [Bacteroidales bacterium]
MKNNESNTSSDLSVEENEPNYKVPNLEKGLAVLELLSIQPQGMTLQEIKNILDISQTTGYRILNTLVRHGYLLYDDHSKTYWLSQKMLTIGFGSLKEHNLMDLVLPKMRELRDEIEESVFFGVLSNDHIIVLEKSIGTHAFCFYLQPGKEAALHCSAPGKAILAMLPEDLKNSYLSRLEFKIHNKNTIADRASFEKELEIVKKRGYALDLEEELIGVICIGAPILNYAGMPCGCLWTSGPKDRLKARTIERFGKRFVEVTQEISRELGFRIK